MIRQNQKLQALLGGQRSARVTMGTLKERQVAGPDCSGYCWPVCASAQVSVGPRAFQIWPSTSLKTALT